MSRFNMQPSHARAPRDVDSDSDWDTRSTSSLSEKVSKEPLPICQKITLLDFTVDVSRPRS